MERIMVKTNIIRIGNSRGIRIPKLLLDQSGLGEEVELEVQNKQILIRQVSRPREGWAEKFRSMANKGDDRLLDPDMVGESSWDKNEWQWE
jgi:antitoxin MazE